MENYIKELLGIQLKGYIVDTEGEILDSEDDPYSYVCLKLFPGSAGKITQILNARCGNGSNYEGEILPGYCGHYLAERMKSQKIIHIYDVSLPGGKIKTRSVSIYLTQDEKGENWLYIFG